MILGDIKSDTKFICEEFDVKRLDIFGSVAREEDSSDSDLDFIVEFKNPEEKPAKRFFGLLHALEDRLKKKIDLIMLEGVRNPYFKDRIEKERINLYEG